MPRERTQQLNEQREAEAQAAEAEAAEAEVAEEEGAATDSSNSNIGGESSNYEPEGWFTTQYQGDGWLSDSSKYDGQTYHNGSFGRDMVISTALISDPDYAYLNVADMGKIVDEYNKDYFTTSGKSITRAIEQLNDVHKGLQDAGYFYQKYPEEEAPLTGTNGIIDLMTKFLEAKKAMDPTLIEGATGAYNDDLEKAKNLIYKEYLKSVCQAYNENPKITGLMMNYSQKMEDGNYQWMGQEFNDYGYFDDSGWNEKTPRYTNIPDNAALNSTWDVNGGNGQVEITDIYKDSICYDFFDNGYQSILDTIFHDVDDLEKELNKRREYVTYDKLEERPAYSYYNNE